jgi:DNA-directed RNA polymerase specialized sigma24 family protein
LSDPVDEDSIGPLNSVSAYDYIHALYRLCLVQSGSDTTAERVVHDIVLEAFKAANCDLAKVDFNGLFRTAFQHRDSYPKLAENNLADWPRVVHSFSEPRRSTLTLFYLEVLPLAVIAEIAGLSVEELADMIREARSVLAEARK